MEARYWGDPINELMFEVPGVDEVLPEKTDLSVFGEVSAPEYADALLPSLDATWSVLDEEPGMDDMMEQAGDSL